MKSKRSSNFELLRTVAMLMIVVYHIYCHCVNGQLTDGTNELFSQPLFYKKLLILASIAPLGKIGNAIFILISGYFMVPKKQIDIVKISKKLVFQQLFAATMLTVTSTFVFYLLRIYKIYPLTINVFNSMSWFVGYYFIIILIAKLGLNRYLARIDKKQCLTFLIVLFTATQLSWVEGVLNNLMSGLLVIVTGLFLYSLGGYIRQYNPFGKVRVYIFVIAILVAYMMIWISNYNLYLLQIRNYGGEGFFTQNIMQYRDNNLICIVVGVSLFELFRRIKLPTNRIINFLGGSTFMVYLIHDNEYFYSLWRTQDWISLLYYRPYAYMIKHLGWALMTFSMGVVMYAIYLFLEWMIPKCKCLAIRKDKNSCGE